MGKFIWHQWAQYVNIFASVCALLSLSTPVAVLSFVLTPFGLTCRCRLGWLLGLFIPQVFLGFRPWFKPHNRNRQIHWPDVHRLYTMWYRVGLFIPRPHPSYQLANSAPYRALGGAMQTYTETDTALLSQ